MKNAITIDLEDWYQTSDFNINPKNWLNYESRIENSAKRLLELLDRHNIKATFFILGYVAKTYPSLVRVIASKGHEIGTHGMNHKMIDKMTPNEFRTDLTSSRYLLEDLTGLKCVLHRAPSWSISEKNLWAFEILEEEGFLCDSSIQPFKTPLSGSDNMPLEPFHPVIAGKKLNIVVFPNTAVKLWNMIIPFSGGFYLRVMPYSIINRMLRNVNKCMPGMVYVHPWETDLGQPVLDYPFYIKFIHYYNIKGTLNKVEMLAKEFSLAPLGEVIKDYHYIYRDLVSNK